MSGRVFASVVAVAVASVVPLVMVGCAGSGDVAVEDSNRTPVVSPGTTITSADPAVDVPAGPTSTPTPTPSSTSGTTADSASTSTTGSSSSPDVSPPSVPQTDVGAAGVGDTLYPTLGNGGYDVAHYSIDLDVDVTTNRIDATTTIEATAIQALARFDLDLHGLDIATVTVDGEDAVFERDGDEVVITPGATIASASAFVVALTYAGVPEPIQDPAVDFEQLGWRERDGVVYVASEPSGAMTWFPGNNHPSDTATFDISVTTADDLTVVANGTLDETTDNGDGTATTTWVMDDAMATYLAAVSIGDFELRESVTTDGVRIRDYFPPALADDLATDFDLTGDVIDFASELFGADYPFDEYGSIVMPFDLGFALENQTISIHGLDGTDANTIAHEIMHQWVGDATTLSQWQDIWMLEGFATYLSYMYLEDRGLPIDLDPQGMYAALGGDSTGPAEVPVDELFGASVYFRGALALHALRVEVGDETFRTILAAQYARAATGAEGGQVSTAEFREVVGDVAGDAAVAVLDRWIFDGELPPFPG